SAAGVGTTRSHRVEGVLPVSSGPSSMPRARQSAASSSLVERQRYSPHAIPTRSSSDEVELASGSNTVNPSELGKIGRCLGSGSAVPSTSLVSSSPAPNSSSSSEPLGSWASGTPSGTKNPVRYQRNGGRRSTSIPVSGS